MRQFFKKSIFRPSKAFSLSIYQGIRRSALTRVIRVAPGNDVALREAGTQDNLKFPRVSHLWRWAAKLIQPKSEKNPVIIENKTNCSRI